MQIVTPTGTASYAHVHRAQPPMDPTKPPQFSLTLLWDKDNPKLKKLKDAIEQVAIAKFGAKAPQMLEKGQLKNPLRDGDEKDDERYEGKVFLTARSTDKPGCVDVDAEPLMNQSDFYSGCQARMDVWVYAFDKAGNKGVACILNNVQKIDDGERLGGGPRSAADAFADADEDDEPAPAPAPTKTTKRR